MKTVTVTYQIATYSGSVQVLCDENDENDVIIAKAKRILKNKVGNLPFGYESWNIVND